MVDSGFVDDAFGSMAECISDVFRLDVVPGFGGRVVVAACGGIQGSPTLEVAVDDSAEGLGAAQHRVVRGRVTNEFSLDGILLVSEGEVSVLDELDLVRIIQRCRWRGVHGTANVELDVTEQEGFRAGVVRSVQIVAEAFGWAQEPEVGDDDEVDDMDLHCPESRVLGVQGDEEFFEDDGVDGVGPRGGVVLHSECVQEIRECGTVLFGSCMREAGIFFTQVGDPLADGSEDRRYGVSSDIVLTTTGALPQAVGVDEDVVEPVVDVWDSRKRRVNSVGLAELGPLSELLALGSPGARDIGLRGGFERRAEISREASSGLRVRIRQGLRCG